MKKINFNQINNPTQINVGTAKNSAQTIGDGISKALSGPNAINATLKFIIKYIALSFYVIVVCAAGPILISLFVGITLLSIINGADLNHLITFVYPETFRMLKWLVSKIMFDVFPAALPIIVIWGCCGLFFFLFARNVMKMK